MHLYLYVQGVSSSILCFLLNSLFPPQFFVFLQGEIRWYRLCRFLSTVSQVAEVEQALRAAAAAQRTALTALDTRPLLRCGQTPYLWWYRKVGI
jgi:hypothetical protein